MILDMERIGHTRLTRGAYALNGGKSTHKLTSIYHSIRRVAVALEEVPREYDTFSARMSQTHRQQNSYINGTYDILYISHILPNHKHLTGLRIDHKTLRFASSIYAAVVYKSELYHGRKHLKTFVSPAAR